MDPAKGPVVCPARSLEKLDIKGTTVFKRVDTYYGPKPLITGYGYQLFTNADAAVQALKSGQVDCCRLTSLPRPRLRSRVDAKLQ